MLTISTFIKNSTESSKQSKKTRKNINIEQEVKLSIFAEDVNV